MYCGSSAPLQKYVQLLSVQLSARCLLCQQSKIWYIPLHRWYLLGYVRLRQADGRVVCISEQHSCWRALRIWTIYSVYSSRKAVGYVSCFQWTVWRQVNSLKSSKSKMKNLFTVQYLSIQDNVFERMRYLAGLFRQLIKMSSVMNIDICVWILMVSIDVQYLTTVSAFGMTLISLTLVKTLVGTGVVKESKLLKEWPWWMGKSERSEAHEDCAIYSRISICSKDLLEY